jgi:HSP20 family protein
MFDLLPLKRRGEVPGLLTEMDDLMKKLWVGFPFHELDKDVDIGWSPRLDVSETDKAIQVIADLPGIDKKDITVSLEDNLLTIKGERKTEKETKEKRYHTIERSSGSFYRAMRLPVQVIKEKIEATFKDGVLTLNLPKAAPAAKDVAQIPIK